MEWPSRRRVLTKVALRQLDTFFLWNPLSGQEIIGDCPGSVICLGYRKKIRSSVAMCCSYVSVVGLLVKKKLALTGNNDLEKKKEAETPRKRQTARHAKKLCYVLLSFALKVHGHKKMDNVGELCSDHYPGGQFSTSTGKTQTQKN